MDCLEILKCLESQRKKHPESDGSCQNVVNISFRIKPNNKMQTQKFGSIAETLTFLQNQINEVRVLGVTIDSTRFLK
jgi:hypothetical protein